jgi:hypothetical protein
MLSLLRTNGLKSFSKVCYGYRSSSSSSSVLLSKQQHIVDVLIKDKLEDTIKNKIPELLSVAEEDITQFVHDLFDLKKMELILPTRHGNVPILL